MRPLLFLADLTFGATFDGYFEEIHFKAPTVVNFLSLKQRACVFCHVFFVVV